MFLSGCLYYISRLFKIRVIPRSLFRIGCPAPSPVWCSCLELRGLTASWFSQCCALCPLTTSHSSSSSQFRTLLHKLRVKDITSKTVSLINSTISHNQSCLILPGARLKVYWDTFAELINNESFLVSPHVCCLNPPLCKITSLFHILASIPQ